MTTPERIELKGGYCLKQLYLDKGKPFYRLYDQHGEMVHPPYTPKIAQAFAAAMQGEGMGEERINRAYSERVMCSVGLARMAIANGYKAGTGLDAKGQVVLYVDTPSGQVSWHIWDVDQWMLEGLPVYDGEWDGEFRGRDGKWCIWDITHPPASANPVTPSAESVAREIGQISGWQPMDTAPKDGTEFLAMMERVDFEGDVRRAMVFAAWDTTLGEFVRMDMMSQNGWEPTDYLTEWMYCPTQPNPNPAAEEFANSPRQALANKGPAMSNPLLSAFLHNISSMLAHHDAQHLKRVEGPGSMQFDEVVAGQLNALRELYPEVAGETMFFHNPDGSMPMVPNPNKEDTSGNGGRKI